MKGRKPTPTHLKLLRGAQNSKINHAEPQARGDLMNAPGDLPPGAVPFWNYAIAAAPRSLLRRLDQRTLAIYAAAAWAHSDAMNKLAKSRTLLRQKKGSDAIHVSPYLNIMSTQAGIMLRAIAELGFSPVSRSRIVTREGELAEPSNQFEEFAS